MEKSTAEEIIKILKLNIEEPKCELNFSNIFELLIAVILSAQCTDARVNIVTKDLFKELKTPEDFAFAPIEKIEQLIKPCGFFHNKARNIKACSIMLMEKFGSNVPSDFNDLTSLPGVGRKTASVVFAVGFNKPAMPVDTHLFRVANRLGIYKGNSVEKCEEEYKKIILKEDWILAHHLFLLFGRYVCKAQRPDCENCYLKKYCKK